MKLRKFGGATVGVLGLLCWAYAARLASLPVGDLDAAGKTAWLLEIVGLALIGLGWLFELLLQPSRVHRKWAGIVLGLGAVAALGLGFYAERRLWVLEGTVAFALAWVLGLSMSNVRCLLGRELKAYFYSPIAYVTAAVFLVASGVVFYITIDGFQRACASGQPPYGEVVMGSVLPFISMVMLFVCPMVTMRLLSEEKSTGTVEVLMTAPVTEFEMVVSKFLAGVAFYVYLLAITLAYVGILWWVGRPDYGPIITTYAALLLLGGMYLSVGLLVSSFTHNQIIAAVVTFVILLMMWFVGYAGGALELGEKLAWVKDVCKFVSFDEFFSNFSKGVMETRPLVYGVSFTAAMLFLTIRSVESRKWR